MLMGEWGMKVYVVKFLFNDEEVVLDSIWSEEEGAASRATKIGGSVHRYVDRRSSLTTWNFMLLSELLTNLNLRTVANEIVRTSLSIQKKQERFTYKEVGQMIGKPLSFVYDFCNLKVKYLDPDLALAIDKPLVAERGY